LSENWNCRAVCEPTILSVFGVSPHVLLVATSMIFAPVGVVSSVTSA